MAALGTPPNLAALSAAAAAAGLSWNVNLAATAPTTPSRPPAHAALNAWNGPPPFVPGAGSAGHCNDRPHHYVGGAVPAGALVCASHINPNPHPPGETYLSMTPKRCPRRVGIHGRWFRSFLYCRNHNRIQPWYQAICNNVTNPPAPLTGTVAGAPAPPLQPIATWTQFQTPLCR